MVAPLDGRGGQGIVAAARRLEGGTLQARGLGPGFGGLSLGAVAGGLLARRFGLTAPFWCSFVTMTLLTLAAWPILSTGTVRAAREQAAS